MNAEMLPKTVTFHLTSAQPRAWLVLKSDNQDARVVEMQSREPSDWFARMDLIPGEYRCRFYSGDNQSIHYFGPASIEGSTDCGMDSLVSVTAPEAQGDPQFVQ
jgi:hypothetical protein